MKILSLNASPNRERGNTHYLLDPFLGAAREAGAEVELVNVRDLNVQPCVACGACWPPEGDCSADDDMKWLRPRIAECDVLVLGVPLYVDAMPGPLKVLVDRMLPLGAAQIELVDGHCRHPRKPRFADGLKGIALASVCGFWELDNFDTLVSWTRAICRNLHADFAGALLRPHAYSYRFMPSAAPPKQAVRAALEQAGRELVQTGAISPEAQAAVSAPLVDLETYLARTAAALRQEL